jgi:hypothetical protein
MPVSARTAHRSMMKHREVRLVDRLVTPVAKQIQRTRPNVNALVVPHAMKYLYYSTYSEDHDKGDKKHRAHRQRRDVPQFVKSWNRDQRQQYAARGNQNEELTVVRPWSCDLAAQPLEVYEQLS